MDVPDQESALAECNQRMRNAVEHLHNELTAVRTGRPTVSLLDSVLIQAYGSALPLNQVASLSIPNPSLIVATPYDLSQISAIEKAIQTANLGFNPTNDGRIVRIPIPSLTEERRKELSQLVHKQAEEARTAIRQVRRDVNEALKTLLKNNALSQDDERRALATVQKVTNEHVQKIDTLQASKDEELLQR